MAEEQEVIYGQGIPKVVEPRAPPFQDLVDDIKYKAQLLARETKLSSGFWPQYPWIAIVSSSNIDDDRAVLHIPRGALSYGERRQEAVPVAVVDKDQFNEIMARLDKIDEKD